MNSDFPRVAVMSLVIMLTYSFLASAEAAEIVMPSEFPELPSPGNEWRGLDRYRMDASIAEIRWVAYEWCEKAKLEADKANELLRKIRNREFVANQDEAYKSAYDDYMSSKELCVIWIERLNNALAAEENDDDSTELFDPTDPVTAQWAGTWNVQSTHDYGLAKGGSRTSELDVKISWEGCEVSWSNQEGYDCRVKRNILTFYIFHESDNTKRVDFAFYQSGLTLEGKFSGTIRGKPVGGTFTGEKAGY